MSAGNYDFKIEQGVDREINLSLLNVDGVTPLDITGWTFEMQIRERPSSTAVLLSPTVSIISASLGTFKIVFTAINSATLPANITACYDIEATKADTKKIRLLEGKCFISPEVTK